MHRSLLVLGLSAAPALAHVDPFLVGVDSSGRLAVGFQFGIPEVLHDELPGFPGWLGNELTFNEVFVDDPIRDLHPITDGAKILLEVVLFDPALSLLDQDLGAEFLNPGDQFALGTGGDRFVAHHWWYINRAHPDFDFDSGEWVARFKIVDVTGTHPESPVYSFRAIPPIPAPATALLGLAFLRRRR